MNVAVLVPRRSDNGRRDQLWAFCREWWAKEHPDFEVIEGHHDGGRFNRSAALNAAAARQPTANVLIAADGDVIVPPAQIEAAVKLAAETGRAVLPYGHGGYTPLNRQATDLILSGEAPVDWARPQHMNRAEKSDGHVSSCVIVPRSLWDQLGGYDERFCGWGPEDRAFYHSCLVAGGGVARVDGRVFHLEHPLSPERKKHRDSPDWHAGIALRNYYWSIERPADMARLVAEKRSTNGVLMVIVTNGRTECITRAIESASEQITGPILRRVIVDDSGDPNYQAWLRLHFGDFDLLCTKGRQGFDGAYRRVWEVVAYFGLPWAFIVEDDFTFERPVDLTELQAAMTANPNLVQMALRRQAWFPGELAVGGVVEQHPDDYTDTPTHLEHRLFTTTNPSLWSRDFIVRNPWPKGPSSEARFARQVFKDPETRAGYWGQRTDAPWVIHDGERVGSSY